MTDTEQIKAIAELDGWTLQEVTINSHVEASYKDTMWTKEGCMAGGVPNYLTSRDAIIPVIEKLYSKNDYEAGKFIDVLAVIIGHEHNLGTHCIGLVISTPKQLCEALLRATNKWYD